MHGPVQSESLGPDSSKVSVFPGVVSSERPAADDDRLKLEAAVQVRLKLQRRASRNLRRHAGRAVWRVLVLVASDLAAFWLLREALRAVRESALFGPWLAERLDYVLPAGHLDGWQFLVALLIGLFLTGNYGQGDQRRNPRRLLLGCTLATALPLWAALWMRGITATLIQYGLTVGLLWLVLVAERLFVDRLVTRVRPPAKHAAHTVFVGTAAGCRRALASPAFRSGNEYRPIGFVDVNTPASPGALGWVGDFPAVLATSGAEVVVVCGYLSDNNFHEVVDASLAAGCQVLSVPRAVEIAGVEPWVVWRAGQPLVQLTAPSLRGQQLVIKRALDILGALVGLVLLAPVFLIIAVLIKRDSRGPVFFRQVRVGRGGRLFDIIKFRTMVDGAHGQMDALRAQNLYADARLFKVARDPRTTKVGRRLRRTSLDELPQLINVLRGEMSLVGPRPPLPAEVALYEMHQYARFDVTPGLTGPWQVAGRNDITDFNRIVMLETEYIRNWSILSDVAILFRTIPAVFRMRGAH